MSNGLEVPTELPSDNDGWFKRHIIEKLDDLKTGQVQFNASQQEMHSANIKRMDIIAESLQRHEESDIQKFGEIKQDISELQPVKKLVYAGAAMILVAFLGVLIGIVITKHG